MKKLLSFLIVLLAFLITPNTHAGKKITLSADINPQSTTITAATLQHKKSDGTWEEIDKETNTNPTQLLAANLKGQTTNEIHTFKMGDICIDVDPTGLTYTPTNNLYVPNSGRWGVGLHAHAKFKVYPDPDKYGNPKVFSVKLKSRGDLKYTKSPGTSYPIQTISAYNISDMMTGSGANIPSGVTISKYNCASDLTGTAEYILLLTSETGVANSYITIGFPNNAAYAAATPWNGKLPTGVLEAWGQMAQCKYVGIMVSAIDIEIESDEPDDPADIVIGTPKSKNNQECTQDDDGTWRFYGTATFTPTVANDDDFTGAHKFYYVYNEVDQQQFNGVSSTMLCQCSEGESIIIDEPTTLTIASVGFHNGKEYRGTIQHVKFAPAKPASVALGNINGLFAENKFYDPISISPTVTDPYYTADNLSIYYYLSTSAVAPGNFKVSGNGAATKYTPGTPINVDKTSVLTIAAVAKHQTEYAGKVDVVGEVTSQSFTQIIVPKPGAVSIGAPSLAGSDDKTWKFFGTTAVKPTSADDAYAGLHRYYYQISDAALTQMDTTSTDVTKLSEGATININRECCLNLLNAGIYDRGGTPALSVGDIVSFRFIPGTIGTVSIGTPGNWTEETKTCNFFDNIAVTPTTSSDDFAAANHDYYYLISDAAPENFSTTAEGVQKISNGAAITIDYDCVLTIVSAGKYTKYGEAAEAVGAPQSFTFKKVIVTKPGEVNIGEPYKTDDYGTRLFVGETVITPTAASEDYAGKHKFYYSIGESEAAIDTTRTAFVYDGGSITIDKNCTLTIASAGRYQRYDKEAIELGDVKTYKFARCVPSDVNIGNPGIKEGDTYKFFDQVDVRPTAAADDYTAGHEFYYIISSAPVAAANFTPTASGMQRVAEGGTIKINKECVLTIASAGKYGDGGLAMGNVFSYRFVPFVVTDPADANIGTPGKLDEGVYTFIGETVLAPTAADDDYNTSGSRVYFYIKSDTEITAADFTAKIEAKDPSVKSLNDGETLTITDDCWIIIASAGKYIRYDEEAYALGKISSYHFSPIAQSEYMVVDSYADFTAENNGRLMALNFPLNLYASLYGATTATAKDHTILARDLNGKVLKIVTVGVDGALADWTDFGDMNDPEARTYAKPMTFKGLYQHRDGHPELLVASAEVDLSEYVSAKQVAGLTGDAAAGVADREGLFASFPATATATNIDPTLWGSFVTLRHVTSNSSVAATAATGFNVTDIDGAAVEIDKIYSADVKLSANSPYNLTGVVEYNPSTKSFYLSPISAVEIAKSPEIKLESFTKQHPDATEIEGDVDQLEWHVNTPDGTLNITLWYNQTGESLKGKDFHYEVTDMYAEDKTKTFIQSGDTREDHPMTISMITDPIAMPNVANFGGMERLTAKDGGYLLRIVTKIRERSGTNSNLNDPVIAESEPVFVKIHDDFAGIPTYSSIADLLADFKGKTAEEIGDKCYVELVTPAEMDQNDGAFAVRDMTRYCLTLSDATDLEGNNLVLVRNSSENGWNDDLGNSYVKDYFTSTMSAANNGWFWTMRDDFLKKNSANTTVYCRRKLLPGDGITRMAAKVCIENGVVVLDAANISDYIYGQNPNRFESYYPTPSTTTGQSEVLKRYSFLNNGYESVEEVEAPEAAEFKAKDVDRIVVLKNLKIKSENGSVAATTQAASRKAVALATLADETATETPAETSDNFYAVTASNLQLSWDYMTTETEKAAHQTRIAEADEDATFTVRGLLLNDNAGGVKLEVISLLGTTAKIYYTCEHQSHETYWRKVEVDKALDGQLIELRGVNITRDDETGEPTTWKRPYYVNIGNGKMLLDWEDETKDESDRQFIGHYIGAVKDEDNNQVFATKTKLNITGYVKFDETGDGSKLFVESVSPVEGKAPFKVTLVAAPNSSDGTFGTDSRPTLMAVSTTDGTMHQLSTTVPIYYRMLSVDNKTFGDKVKDRLPNISGGSDELTRVNAAITFTSRDEFKDCTLPWLPYHQGVFALMNTSYIVQVVSCTPGIAAPFMENSIVGQDTYSYFFFEKVSTDVDNVTALIEDQTTYTAINPGADGEEMEFSGMYYLKNLARVLEVEPERGMLTLTDGQSIVGVRYDTDAATFHAGDYIENLPLEREGHEWIYDYAGGPQSKLEPAETPAVEITLPEPELVGKELTAAKGKFVKVLRSKLSNADGEWTVSGSAETDANVMPATTHMGWSAADIDQEKEYIVTGIVMPRTPLTAVAAQADNADADLEMWMLSSTEVRYTKTPVITIADAESESDGVAVTVTPVTVTIAAEEGDIEISLDGGTTWTPYTAPVIVSASAEVKARATVGDMYPSVPASKTIRYEYYSGKVAFAQPELKAGYTTLAIAPADNLADGSYTIRYTTDGSEPTSNSTAYTAPIEFETAGTVKAALFENGKRKGETLSTQVSVKSGNVKISVVDDEQGTHVTLAPESTSHLAASYDIFYAFDGGDGTWSRYSAGIHIADDCKIMAYMVEQGKDEGDTIELTVTAIETVGADSDEKVSVEGDTIIAPEGSQVYDLTGRRVRPEGLRAGIYIVRLPGGKAVKVAVK